MVIILGRGQSFVQTILQTKLEQYGNPSTVTPQTVLRQFWYLWNGSSGVCGMAVLVSVERQF